MKQLAVIAAVVAVLAPTAYATGQALDPRVPGLKRQVNALNAKVKAQGEDIAAVLAYSRCIAGNQQPLARYSVNAGGFAFTYLDYAHAGDAPHGYLQYPGAKCSMP